MYENRMLETVEELKVIYLIVKSIENYGSIRVGIQYSEKSLEAHVQKGLGCIEVLKQQIMLTSQKREELFHYAQEMCSALATGSTTVIEDHKSVQSLESLGLRPVIIHHIRKAGIHSVTELLACDWIVLRKTPGFGSKKIEEIVRTLAAHGLYK